MAKPGKYFQLKIGYDQDTTITRALRQRGKYDRNLLYRFFAVGRNDQKPARIEEILRRGTDRTSDLAQSEHDTVQTYGPYPGDRLLKPSEYLYAAPENEIREQFDSVDPKGGDIFVSVYDSTKMLQYGDEYCFEFKDKERPQDALVALIELNHESTQGSR